MDKSEKLENDRTEYEESQKLEYLYRRKADHFGEQIHKLNLELYDYCKEGERYYKLEKQAVQNNEEYLKYYRLRCKCAYLMRGLSELRKDYIEKHDAYTTISNRLFAKYFWKPAPKPYRFPSLKFIIITILAIMIPIILVMNSVNESWVIFYCIFFVTYFLIDLKISKFKGW